MLSFSYLLVIMKSSLVLQTVLNVHMFAIALY